MRPGLRDFVIVPVTVLVLVFIINLRPASAANSSVAGNYICKSTRGKPCSTNTPLQLVDNGVWRWGRYGGNYTISNGHVQFTGVGGAASWGSAIIGADTLTFNDFGDSSVWQRPSTPSPQLSGVYYCSTAPSGCQTSHPLELRADNTWSWGPQGGSYSILGGQVHFSGSTWGPAGWGPAEFENGALVFKGPSVWKRERSQTGFTGDPRDFDLSGFPPRPTNFEEQRIMAAIQSARDPRNAANPAVFQEQGHRMLGQWYINRGDQKRGTNEQAKALYWKNGGQ